MKRTSIRLVLALTAVLAGGATRIVQDQRGVCSDGIQFWIALLDSSQLVRF